LWCGGAGPRAAAVAHCFAHALKVGDGDQAARVGQRVAGLVPIGVVFAANYVQEVALGETEVAGARVGVGGVVVVEGLDDL
jgi:hypothetical protein